MVHPYINAGSGFYCLGCTMSYSRCLSLSALLASTFITPVAAMDLTLLSPNNNAILEYTHTNTPVPEPASFSFSEQAYKIAAICFLGYGNCDNEISYGKGDETYNMDTANQCKNEGFVSTCSSGYCMDGSCSYNASYGKCIAENCPTNSSPTCTGAVVGKTACGGDCKQCCSDTCTSGSKSYTGSYASTTECGTKCYYCNTSCSSGSTSYTGSVVGYNECGSACRSCSTTCSSGSLSYTGDVVSYNECGSACRSCSTSCPSGTSTSYSGSTSSYNECGSACKNCSSTCPSGYSTSNPGGCYDTTTNECGNTCYKSKACCSDTCTSGSTSYTGSYASTTECGTKCYYCNTSCSSGSTSYSGSVIGYNECGSACRSCSDTCTSGSKSSSCDSGYTASTVSSTECGSTCYSCTANACSGYSLTSCPTNGSCSSCLSGTTTKYKLNSCDSGYTMSGSSCVKDDPCDNYTSKTCTYGCSAYYSDCSTKCQTCYSDNCHNRTAVIASCPTNATCSYFSDCSSKIESWTCNSGYSKSGSSCVEDTPCISYDGQDCAYSGCPTYTCTCCPSFGGFNSSCCMYDDMCTTVGHPMCTDAVPYVVGSCCCPTSTQTSTYNCDCCVSEVQ